MTTIDRERQPMPRASMSQPQRDQYRPHRQRHHPRVDAAAPTELRVGGIERRDVGLQVADNDDLNVLGMNFLSSLSRWGVEGRWLVLVP